MLKYQIRYKKLIGIFILLWIVMIGFCGNITAATGINEQINFQGKLLKTDGTNATDGTAYEIVFKLYNVSSGGTAIWTETHTGVTVTDGVFHELLGSSSSLSGVDFNNDTLYLGMQITKDYSGAGTADAEMSPRMRFTAVPYAFNAEKVNGLTVTNTSNAPFSSATALKINDGSTITFGGSFTTSGANALTLTTSGTTNATLPAGTITLVDLAASQTLTNKTLSTGSTWNGNVISSTYGGTGANLSTGAAGGVPYFASTGVMGAVGAGTSGYVLTSGGSGTPTWTAPGALGVKWSSLIDPSAALSLSMAANATTFTYNATTSTTNLFNLTDTASNTGTGYLLNVTTASSSTLKPFHVSAAGTEAITVLSSGKVGVGTASPASLFQFDSSSYTSAAFLINNGRTGSAPTGYPAGNSPSLTVITSETSGSRPLFFGYDNGSGGWGATIDAGACGSFSSMCLNMGDNGNHYTALNNSGTTLNIGGGTDGNFTTVAAIPTTTASGGATSYGVKLTPTLSGAINSAQTAQYMNYNVPTINLTGTSATVTSLYGNYVGLTATAGTATTWYGNYVAAPTGAGTVSTKYAFVSESTAGNVGIGTTAPSSLLSVGSSSQFQVDSSGDIVKLKNLTYSWPSSHTSSGFLQDNGSGTLTWTTTVAATSVPFSGITGATNTSAAMVVGTGASLNFSGSGTINSSTLLGFTWAAPGTIGSGTPNTGAFTTLTASGNSTLGTGSSTTNTFGAGASSINTIGSVTTPGALTLHGATTLDNTFSQTGNNTFGTGTGAVSINGDTTIATNKGLTFTSGTGSITQTYVNTVASTADTRNVTNNYASTSPTVVNGLSLAFTNGTNTNNVNTVNGINFPAATNTNTNTINGLNFASATGFTNFLKTPSIVITSGGTITGATWNANTIGTIYGGTGLASYTTGDLIYASGSNTLAQRAIGSSNQFLTVSGGVPTWTTFSPGTYCTTCIVSNPSATQSITPQVGSITGLTVYQAPSGTSDVFDIFNIDGSTRYMFIDSTGKMTLSAQLKASNGIDMNSQVLQNIGTFRICVCVGGYRFQNNDGTVTWANLSQPDGNLSIGNGTTDGTSKLEVKGSDSTSSNSSLNIYNSSSNSMLFVRNDGNVGLGTTSPATVLDVRGDTLTTEADNTISTATFTGTISKNNTNTRTFPVFQIAPTISPGSSNANLTVNGLSVSPTLNAALGNATTTVNVLNINTTNTSVLGITTNLIKASYGGTQKMLVNSSGDLTMAGNGSMVGLTLSGNLTFSNAATVSLATSATALNFASNLLDIDTTNSRVGVGTASPASRFVVSGSESTANGQAAAIQLSNTASGGANWYWRVGSGPSTTNTPPGGFSFANDSAYMLTMTSGGNLGLGIGNGSAASRLVVQGSDSTSSNNALNITDSGTNSILLVRDDGRVGINNTSPGYTMSVVKSVSSGTVAAMLNTSTTNDTNTNVLRLSLGTSTAGTSSRFAEFYAGATTDSNGTRVGRIQLNGTGSTFTSGNGDFAEYVDVGESVTPGDIIASGSRGNVKATNGTAVVGVVSDTAAFLGNAVADEPGPNQAIMGFVGQINTKVSTINGPIHVGDAISASSIPGVGQKATTSGYIIGKALEDYTVSDPSVVKRIKVLVTVAWYDPGLVVDALGTQVNNLSSLFQENTTATSGTVSTLESRVGSLEQKVSGLDFSVLSLLESQGGLVVNGTATFKGETTFEQLVTFISNVVFRGNVTFEKTPTFNSDTAGFAVIRQGQDKVDVQFDNVYDMAPVVNANISLDEVTLPDGTVQEAKLAAQSVFDQGVAYVITNKTARGFSIVLNKAADKDIQFSWVAIAVKNAKTSFSTAAVATPTPQVSTVPTATPSSVPTVQPTVTPTLTVSPTVAPTQQPSPLPSPTAEPTVLPSETPSPTP